MLRFFLLLKLTVSQIYQILRMNLRTSQGSIAYTKSNKLFILILLNRLYAKDISRRSIESEGQSNC